jgi:hypothetical protein
MKPMILALLLVAALVPAQSNQRFTGTITDSMCPAGDHSRMRMGPSNTECTIACVHSHGSPYVLYDGKETYALSDQVTPEKFAGKKVAVTGTLNARTKTIQVTSIAASN